MTTLKDVTREELERMIEDTIERRLQTLIETLMHDKTKDERSLEEVFASIDRNMWTPPPGAKTSLELLREDRER